jgi:hypothetical protein
MNTEKNSRFSSEYFSISVNPPAPSVYEPAPDVYECEARMWGVVTRVQGVLIRGKMVFRFSCHFEKNFIRKLLTLPSKTKIIEQPRREGSKSFNALKT